MQFNGISRWFIFILFCKFLACGEILEENLQNTTTDIAEEGDDRLLLFSTLEGNLIAVEQQSGAVRWKVKDEPIVKVPLDTADAIIPVFLPDPRDGSLYLLGNSREPLKKLPFTIPQLVISSPCRSSDGILYTGKKKDTWYKLDPQTGRRQQILGWDTTITTCPIETNNFVYIGRTKYSVMMVDTTKPRRKWNVTFYDYTATSMTKDEINNYDLVHFASTSSGRIVTLDRRRGNLLWDADFGSPIVAAYLLDSDGLMQVPFTSLANHTINYLANHLLLDGSFQTAPHMKLYPTLYVGEHLYGLYAIPSLVDQNVVTITASDAGPLLLGGPHAPDLPKPCPEYPLPGHNYRMPSNVYNTDTISFQSMPQFKDLFVIYSGHYNVPRYSQMKLIGFSSKPVPLLTDESQPSDKLRKKSDTQSINEPKKSSIGVQANDKEIVKESIVHNRVMNPKNVQEYVQVVYKDVKFWINQQENKGMKLTLIVLSGCVVAMFWYLQVQVREFQNLSQNGSKSSQKSSVGRNGAITAVSEELPDGLVRVGKIVFHPEQLLGKGCEGTFVYRGEFDSRRVAVKRLLPECFTFADREVALLRESDAHPHVIRYYCMEQDRMFRYIALELCQATLSDFVQGNCDAPNITPLEILRQATSGLAHLHSLDIVHRDIKPHNVLLSVPNSRGEVRAMISDFGLCKKLQVGRVSFSRRSGVTGTDGWIAPEMLNGAERTTCAVDLFSLGCLFYYVLSEGKHPFGDSLRRQANILSGEWDLTELKGAPWKVNLLTPLVSALISSNPEERPPCNAVLAHPMFWNSAKILAFFQDVSDRVEKAQLDNPVLLMLEDGSEAVVKQDWRAHIHDEVARDLRKYRTYHGESVRDLLRALRNKKHHFRELSKEAQESLGEVPEAFTYYWTSRFPLLLIHVWVMMQCVSKENTFLHYYHRSYQYSLLNYKAQVIKFVKDNPVVLPEEASFNDLFNKKKDEASELKSPRRLLKINHSDKINRRCDRRSIKRDLQDRDNAGLGLYRNINPLNASTSAVSVSDINLTVSDEKVFSQSPNRRTQQHKRLLSRKKKTPKTNEEPLVWVIQDDK